MSETRDIWGKSKAVGGLFGGIAAFLTVVVSLLGLASRLERDKLDRLQCYAFIEIFDQSVGREAEKRRRMAPAIINTISSPRLRSELRYRVVWALLEAHMADPTKSKEVPRFRFDADESDWHLLGEIVLDLRDDNIRTDDFDKWWNESIKAHLLTARWPQHADELKKLFSWVEITYLESTLSPKKRSFPNSQEGWGSTVLLCIYSVALVVLMIFVFHRLMLWWRFRSYLPVPVPSSNVDNSYRILVQLPVFNERYVASRVIKAAAQIPPKYQLLLQQFGLTKEEYIKHTNNVL